MTTTTAYYTNDAPLATDIDQALALVCTPPAVGCVSLFRSGPWAPWDAAKDVWTGDAAETALWLSVDEAAPASPPYAAKEPLEEGEVSPLATDDYAAFSRSSSVTAVYVDTASVDGDAEAAPEAQQAPKRMRVFFSGEYKKMWGGAVPPKARKAPKKPKALRVKLPASGATLAAGALVYGMVGAKAEERRRLIEAARELRGASEGWAQAIEETLNARTEGPLLSFGRGADDDLDLRRGGHAGVAKHAEAIIDALDFLRAPYNAEAAAERGLLVRWPECLPQGVLRCAALHAYLDAWTEGRELVRGA
jgi:hypothetical protein